MTATYPESRTAGKAARARSGALPFACRKALPKGMRSFRSIRKVYVPFTLTIPTELAVKDLTVLIRLVDKAAAAPAAGEPAAIAYETLHFVSLQGSAPYRVSRAFAVPAGDYDVYVVMKEAQQARQLLRSLQALAARTDMREMVVHGLIHAAAMGEDGALESARMLAEEIDNPRLQDLLATTL